MTLSFKLILLYIVRILADHTNR